MHACLRVLSCWCWLLALGAVLLTGTVSRAQSENMVKCAFVYNFAKLIEWPEASFPSGSTKLAVGFVGNTPLADAFTQATTGKNANGHEFEIHKLGGAGEAVSCHIVVVCDAGQTDAVLATVKGRPVLTVGDIDGFTAAGGMIGLMKDGAKVTFELNVAPSAEAGIKLDPKLRKIAKAVKS